MLKVNDFMSSFFQVMEWRSVSLQRRWSLRQLRLTAECWGVAPRRSVSTSHQQTCSHVSAVRDIRFVYFDIVKIHSNVQELNEWQSVSVHVSVTSAKVVSSFQFYSFLLNSLFISIFQALSQVLS